MLRLTKLANTVLTKKYHDIPDGDLILTGQLKPFMSGNMLDVESPELLFCSVKACFEAASYKCDQVNESDNPCSDMNFCVVHGPDHQLHNTKSVKTLKDHEELRQRYNEELFRTAMKKVQDKLDTLKVTEVKKKTIRNKSITQISTLIINKDEVTTQITSKKVKDKDAIIAKIKNFSKKLIQGLQIIIHLKQSIRILLIVWPSMIVMMRKCNVTRKLNMIMEDLFLKSYYLMLSIILLTKPTMVADVVSISISKFIWRNN